ncbi:MAG: globin family protein [Pseudobdellovibrio sp.]
MGLDIILLRASIEAVKPVSDEFATQFYKQLFEISPEARALFSKTSFEKQKTMLIASIVTIVANVDKPDKLMPYLKNMGARHLNYGTVVEHYPVVGDALMKTFRYFFKEQWSPELESTWTAAYKVISETMLEGAKEAQFKQTAQATTTEFNMHSNFSNDIKQKTQNVLNSEPAISQIPVGLNEWLNDWTQDILKQFIARVTNSPQFKLEMEKNASELLNEYLQKQAEQFRSEFNKAA